MSKQIFAKIAKIGEEVREAQEPMRVELGVQEDLQSFINLLDQKSSYLNQLATDANQKINEFNALAKELNRIASFSGGFYSETLKTVRDSEAYLKNLLTKLKELNMSFNDFPKASVLDKKLDDMGKVLDGFTAIKNINAQTIDKKV
jgi:hypothetical protein